MTEEKTGKQGKSEFRNEELAEIIIDEKRNTKTFLYHYVDGRPEFAPGEVVNRDVKVENLKTGTVIFDQTSNKGGFLRRYISAEEAKYYKPIKKAHPDIDYKKETSKK